MKQIKPAMNASEFAAFTKVAAGTITTWLEEKMPSKRAARSGAEVSIDVRRAVPWLVKRYRERGGADFARIQKARAQKFELENARRRGELALVADINVLLAEIATELVSRLEAVPGRLANELAGISDAGAIRQRLLEEVRAVRSALSDRMAMPPKLAGGKA
jgi:phage terminase Nu1 subunit (DNA packaging protein)